MRVEQLHVGAELVQLDQVDRPVLVHPVVDQRPALRRRGDHGEERQVVDVEPRERHRVDLVRPRRAARDGWTVRSTSRVLAVVGRVLRRQVEVRAPSRPGWPARSRGTRSGSAGSVSSDFGDDRRRDQAHRLDRVLRGGERDVRVDVVAGRATVQRGGADARRSARRAPGGRSTGPGPCSCGLALRIIGEARGLSRRHQHVLGDGVATLGEGDRATVAARSGRRTWPGSSPRWS